MTENGRRKRVLTPEEAELWAFAMRDARALRRERRGPAPSPDDVAAPPSAPHSDAPAPSAAATDAAGASEALSHAPSARIAARSAPKPPPPPAALDRRQTRLVATGRTAIDAVIDLHGMRQREAHGALRAFIISAAARGCRIVLVITGKGRKATEAGQDFFSALQEPGVLRRIVPQWLAAPDLAPHVVGFGLSDARHGGEGALYVRLRRPRA